MAANIESIFGGAFVPRSYPVQDASAIFLAKLQAAGFVVDHLVANTLQRCQAADDRKSKKPLWYVWHPGEVPGGCWGDWRTGHVDKWFARSESELTPMQRQRQQAQIDAAKAAQARAQAEAAIVAQESHTEAGPADPNHPYLKSKGIKPYGDIRQSGDQLIVPALGASGNVSTIQTIGPDGSKYFMSGAKAAGAWFTIPGATSTIYVCEGYATAATVHEATGCETIVAFNANNLIKVAPHIRAKYAQRIIFAADNDRFGSINVGVRDASIAAASIGATYIAPTFADAAQGTDFNDLAQGEGIEAVQAQLVTNEFAFPLSRVDSLAVTEIQWLVDGYFEQDSLSLIFGEPGCGKSFIAISLACAIATGTPWYGRKVTQGAVVYIAGEGHNGLARRFKAWEKATGISLAGAPLYKSHRAAPLMDATALMQVVESIDAIKEKVVLIIIDTLARNFGGDENSTQDMSQFIQNGDFLKSRYGCSVSAVHHSGKASPGQARGSTALRGAVDAEYSVDRDPTSLVIAFANKKMKDGEVPSPMQFSIKSVGLGVQDGNGQEITGGFLESVDLSTFVDKAKLAAEYMGKNQRKCLTALEGIVYARKGQTITLDDWRDACGDAGIERNRFKEARDALVGRKIVSIIGNEVKLSTSKNASEQASESL